MVLSAFRPGLNSEVVGVWARIPFFWRCQLLGWMAFIVLSLPLRMVILGGTPSAVIVALYRDGLAFLLTTFVMRMIYRGIFRWQLTMARIAAVVTIVCLIGGLAQLVLTLTLHQVGDFEEEKVLTGFLRFGVLLYFSAGVLVCWSLLYFGIKLMKAARDRELRLVQAEAAKREAELQMLRAQVNPHFLFNALNTIRAKAEGFGHELRDIVHSLADYLRYSLEHRDRDLVPLGKEYEAMMNYLKIEKARFGDKLEVDCQIEDAARGVAVPGIILQPLVENAIKHGRRTSHTPLKIRVRVFCADGDSVHIEVSNTGSWMESKDAEKPGGIGLDNLRRRLDLLHPGRHNLKITNDDGWVKILVCLPTGMENGQGVARADC
jgi:two-component system LytT family sensor kinase